MLCHQLRSKGDVDFDEISGVVPWIELAHDLGQDLGAPQPFSPPRLFKTHAWEPHCPKGAGVKIVVGVRDPEDVVRHVRWMDGSGILESSIGAHGCLIDRHTK